MSTPFRSSVAIVIAIAIGSLSCAPANSVRGPLPPFVEVSLLGVTVAPFKRDHTSWDAQLPVSSAIVDRVSRAIAAPSEAEALAKVITALADPAVASLERPEVKGTAWIAGQGKAREQRTIFATQNTFTPLFQPYLTWPSVPTDGATTIHVVLIDDDLVFDDPMGSFDLNLSDFARAYDEARVVEVPVHRQTDGQVLFAKIAVRPGRLRRAQPHTPRNSVATTTSPSPTVKGRPIAQPPSQ